MQDHYEPYFDYQLFFEKTRRVMEAAVREKKIILSTPQPHDPLSDKGVAPGTRVLVYMSKTKTYSLATVLRHYGRPEKYYTEYYLGPYPSLVDVQLEDGTISTGHFTTGLKVLKGKEDALF